MMRTDVMSCPLSMAASLSIRRVATSCFVRCSQLSRPAAETSCTVFWSPPKTPRSALTSLATIRSQPFFFSLSRALATRFSVSAANPTTSFGRLAACLGNRHAEYPDFRRVAAMASRFASFLIFCRRLLRHPPVGDGGREDGDVAGELPLAGCQHFNGTGHRDHLHAGRNGKIHRA